jgi:hypothetical protein
MIQIRSRGKRRLPLQMFNMYQHLSELVSDRTYSLTEIITYGAGINNALTKDFSRN